MFQRLSNGWELAKSSWWVLKLDRELLVFPLLSGIACLMVLASFAVPLAGSELLDSLMADEGEGYRNPLGWVLGFAFYFANYFVIVYFNAAMIACAIIRFRGGDPTLADGFRAATARTPQIVAWAFVSATVGLILQAVRSKRSGGTRFIAGLVGMAWGAATFLVVPILVMEKLGPIDAIKRSVELLRKSWGESLAANFGIGIIVMLASFIAILGGGAVVAAGIASESTTLIVFGVAIAVVLIILVSLISSALNAIVVAALYEYASGGSTPAQFDDDRIRGAFVMR